MNETDQFPGGLADKFTLEEIADKHKVSLDDLTKEFDKGVEVEMEHTDDEEVAQEIAKDHLFEDPKYYTKLATIEEGKEFSESELDEVVKFVKTIRTWFEIYDEDDTYEVMIHTRDNGSVGDEEAGEEDIEEANRLLKLIKKKFPKLDYDIEVVDEWVHLTVKPK
tara:strand:+ start:269 stop:763 length:495 start_codon:yes stop_codon:yes gene_type:complete